MAPSSRSGKAIRSRLFHLLVAVAVLSCIAPISAQTPGFTSFDTPHAGTRANQGTIPVKINASGVITGYYVDSGNSAHGFVRTAGGAITEFDATGLSGTVVSGINRSGQIVGTGLHATSHGNTVHGFLRFPDGRFILVNAPAASETLPAGVNDGGDVAGWYLDLGNVAHSFLCDTKGNYTVIDDPNAVTGKPNDGTFITAIHNSGTVVGFYDDSANAVHGFVLNQFGTYTNFDAPDAGNCASCGTFPLAINELGEVTGYYRDNSFVTHGFLRDNLGTITEFSMSDGFETLPESTNNFEETVGQWTNSLHIGRGFTRNASGALSFFSVPVRNVATLPTDINDSGRITGFYIDDNAANHGFLQ
jgi:hypothetical protein